MLDSIIALLQYLYELWRGLPEETKITIIALVVGGMKSFFEEYFDWSHEAAGAAA